MKAFGIILVGMGIALIIFTVMSFFTESRQIMEDQGKEETSLTLPF